MSGCTEPAQANGTDAMPPSGEWLTKATAAELLGVNVQAMRALSGLLKTEVYMRAHTPGRKPTMFLRADIDAVRALIAVSGISVERAGMILRAVRSGELAF